MAAKWTRDDRDSSAINWWGVSGTPKTKNRILTAYKNNLRFIKNMFKF